MSGDDPKTVRVSCPHCDTESAYATIPRSCAVVSETRADGKVTCECRDCGADFYVYFERS